SGDWRSDWITIGVDFHSRLIERRIKRRDCAARFQRRQIQLVTQPKIEYQFARNSQVVLQEEGVVSRAQIASVDAVCVNRVVGDTEQKVVEVLKSYGAAAVVVYGEIISVVDKLGAGANTVATARD